MPLYEYSKELLLKVIKALADSNRSIKAVLLKNYNSQQDKNKILYKDTKDSNALINLWLKHESEDGANKLDNYLAIFKSFFDSLQGFSDSLGIFSCNTFR